MELTLDLETITSLGRNQEQEVTNKTDVTMPTAVLAILVSIFLFLVANIGTAVWFGATLNASVANLKEYVKDKDETQKEELNKLKKSYEDQFRKMEDRQGIQETYLQSLRERLVKIETRR